MMVDSCSVGFAGSRSGKNGHNENRDSRKKDIKIFIILIFTPLFCGAEYPAACCVGSMNKAKPDPKEKIL